MSVTDDAIDRLKAMIRSGEVAPGDRLPPEGALATSLGVSRSSLREAVRALSLLRILDVRQGDGTYVTALAADTLSAALGVVVDFHGDATMLEVIEVRRILEPAASALAATRITEPVLEELERLLAATSASPTVEELVARDVEFHRLIAATAGNAALAAMLDSISGPTLRMRVWRGLVVEGVVERTLDEHRAILDALHRRDPELARSWATVHVSGVEEWVRGALQPRQTSRPGRGGRPPEDGGPDPGRRGSDPGRRGLGPEGRDSGYPPGAIR
ncbi:MAG TPA: FadR/GntR family transcriptional regulator [Solirubrobacteraceae bacterium]|nr:FadR/GntR family transcriptional regulator [Solirubrobacteraceae bacterium]